MRISVHHATRYVYEAAARSIVQVLRVTPRSHAGQQVLDAYASESGEGDHRTTGEGSDSVSGSAASDLTGARRG